MEVNQKMQPKQKFESEILSKSHLHPGMVLWIRIGGVDHMHQNVQADHLMGPHWPS